LTAKQETSGFHAANNFANLLRFTQKTSVATFLRNLRICKSVLKVGKISTNRLRNIFVRISKIFEPVDIYLIKV